jgi:hypothetical protein
MQNYFYRDKEGRDIGPLDLVTLSKFRKAGVLDGDTPVRTSDSAEWKPCREIIADTPVASSATPQPAALPAGRQSIWAIIALVAIVVFLIYAGQKDDSRQPRQGIGSPKTTTAVETEKNPRQRTKSIVAPGRGSISTTDLGGTMQRARELFEEMRVELSRAQGQNQGNDIALRSALAHVRAESKSKREQEFAKLQGQTIQWSFTVRVVKLYFGQVWVYLNEPQSGGIGGDDGTGLYIRFGEGGGWDFLRVGKEMPLSFAEKLRPGDALLVKGRVQVKVGTGEVGPFNILNENVNVEIQLTEINVERAN